MKGVAAQFFQNSLLYLAYTPMASVAVQDQIRLAADIGLAALLGTTVYNFGELVRASWSPRFVVLTIWWRCYSYNIQSYKCCRVPNLNGCLNYYLLSIRATLPHTRE